MPRKSQKEMLEEWEHLLEMVEENAGELPEAQAHQDELRSFYLKARIAKELRDALAEAMVNASHRLKVTLAQGDTAATCLRSCLRNHLGATACLKLRRPPRPEL